MSNPASTNPVDPILTTELEIASVSHVGCVRTNNQDFISISEKDAVIALADGMGGHQAGEVASEIAAGVATEALVYAATYASMDTLQSLIRIGQAVEAANTSVFNLSRKQSDLNGMGTTLVLLMFRDEKVFFAHVGDSRLYRVRDDRIRQITKDHSLIQEVVDQGIFDTREEAMDAGVGENVLTRSLGFSMEVNVDVSESGVIAGDYYLVCSDGLSTYVSDERINAIISLDDLSTDEKVQHLLEAALDVGGKDNISVVLIKVTGSDAP